MSRRLLAPYLDAMRDDIAWMEARLGQTLEEGATGDGPQIGSLEDLPAIAEAARPLLLRVIEDKLVTAVGTPRTHLQQAGTLLRDGCGVDNLARALDAIRLSVG